jgi:hypothetical protein
MKLGAEDKKKVWVLGILMVVAAYFLYSNASASSTPAPRTGTETRPLPTQSIQPRPLLTNRPKNDEFHPVLHPRGHQGESQIEPGSVDPMMHLELLARLQDARIEGGQRNLFQFGATSPVERPQGKGPITVLAKAYVYPRAYVKPDPETPRPEPPPSFKYYGLATKRIDNKRTAFFLDGDEIIFAIEGMTVKSRWRVARIMAESVMLEDTQQSRGVTLKIDTFNERPGDVL